LIASRVNSAQAEYGTHDWKSAPKGKIAKSDVTSPELPERKRNQRSRTHCQAVLDYAENQAARHISHENEDWG